MRSHFKIAACVLSIGAGVLGQVYDNGPYVTHLGGGSGGADASALQTVLGMATYGWGANGATRVADDFVVPCGQVWTISSLTVYAYQTASGPTPSITAANYKIWSGGAPNAGGTVLHDHSATNQATSITFANAYRVLDTGLLDVQRPVMQVVMNGNGITLTPGTYWLDYNLTGSTAFTGPWAVPKTILGTTGTGNALQFFNAVWVALADITAQEFSFKIGYTAAPAPCFQLNITQPGGPGSPVTLADSGGVPGLQAFNIATLYAGAYPAGWLFGVDIPLGEVTSLLSGGVPWVVPLNGSGAFSLTVGVALPFPVTIYYVGVEFNGAQVIATDAAKTITIS